MAHIVPVLLAGGGGTRLWPVSRKLYPKQFSTFFDKETMFQKTAARFGPNSKPRFSPPIVLTNEDFRFICKQQLEAIGIHDAQIVIEPDPKDTGPAALFGALLALEKDPEAVCLLAPSDHNVEQLEELLASIERAFSAAQQGDLVLFGVEPFETNTGYGYIKSQIPDNEFVADVEKFIEKPDLEKATKLLDSGLYYWNSGMLLFKAATLVGQFEKFHPNMLRTVKSVFAHKSYDLNFVRMPDSLWSECESISLDYAILEKNQSIKICKLNSNWSDLGSWDTVWKEQNVDKNGVVELNGGMAVDCQNVLLATADQDQKLVGLGLQNIVAVAMKDAVLVADIERSQDVKFAVEKLRAESVSQANQFPKEHRPWGYFETIHHKGDARVKQIVVEPGLALSKQSHKFRSEHWIVVEGVGEITVNDEEHILKAGESIFVPLGAVHRLKNPGSKPLAIIEVQIGSYLGEDDIIRYEDEFGRT